MKRCEKYRYLKPLKKINTTKDIYVYDSETGYRKGTHIKYDLIARPENYIFGVVYGPNEFVKVLQTPEEAITEFKKRRYRNSLVYMHNAEYDLLATYGSIFDLDPEAIFNGGRFIKATNGNCTFLDSVNILLTSVKVIGDFMGMPKGQLGNDNFESTNINADIGYCIQDCKIVYNALIRMFAECEPCITLGSLSMKIFRYLFLKTVVKVNQYADEFFHSYYGGRTEALFIGDCAGSVYDINSAYSYAMLKSKFPNPETLVKEYSNDLVFIEHVLSNYEGQIKCKVRYKYDIHIPVLPVRMNSKLMFPLGEFEGAWTFTEFRYAYKYLHIISPVELIYSEPIESPFKEFVTDHYNQRQNSSDEFHRYYLKLLLNNLYGKLMQRIHEKTIFVRDKSMIYPKMVSNQCKRAELIDVDNGYFIKMELPEKFTSHTVAPWGAYITAYVRVYLHQMMMRDPTNVLYCDTDSVFVTKDFPIIKDSFDLGGWKRENKLVTNIKAPKNYTYQEGNVYKMKLKGVKKGAIKIGVNEFNKDVWEYKRMIKTKESYKRLDKTPAGVFLNQRKVISGDYDKRIVLNNGKTRPIKL